MPPVAGSWLARSTTRSMLDRSAGPSSSPSIWVRASSTPDSTDAQVVRAAPSSLPHVVRGVRLGPTRPADLAASRTGEHEELERQLDRLGRVFDARTASSAAATSRCGSARMCRTTSFCLPSTGSTRAHGLSGRRFHRDGPLQHRADALPHVQRRLDLHAPDRREDIQHAGTHHILDVLVVYLDGIVFGDYHVLAAVGVDAEGRKHVLGLCGGASENTEVTAGLLEDLVARGLRSDRRRLFVIDGAKALRQAIGRVFGSSNLVQRCRNHQGAERVLGHLPKEQHKQARATLRAAWKLNTGRGHPEAGTRRGWSGTGRRRRRACARGSRSCSRSIVLACRRRCAAA